MSNYLAIATVTAALQQLLQEGIREDVPGANVTTLRPDNPGVMNLSVGINVYLYQATPNPAWRNADLRTRRPKGDLIKHGQAGLDLHYLLTFYGNDQELEPQRLMGSTIKTLVDNPTLTQNAIRNTVNRSNLSCLGDSTLDDQVQLVQFIPSSITTEDMSRIWSVFFQVPYSLSFAYQGMAVLIEGDRSGNAPLPIRTQNSPITSVKNTLFYPVIQDIEAENTVEGTVTINSKLIIKGKQLQHSQAQVRIGEAVVTPQEISETQITVDLSVLREAEKRLLRAGVQGIQVIHPASHSSRSQRYDGGAESNVKPLVLCTTILLEVPGIFASTQEQDEDRYRGEITTQVDIVIGPTQRVFLILNGLSNHDPKSYIFRATRRTNQQSEVAFSITDVIADTYLVRIQIDGAESPLWVNESQEYAGPTVTVP